jgi:drug/metabolite transporter (DMT)-like permease
VRVGLFAYLLAGVIVGGLVWSVRHGPGRPRLPTLLVFGLVGGAIGGLGWNLLKDRSIDDLDGPGFTAAVLVALVLLVGVDVQVRRGED